MGRPAWRHGDCEPQGWSKMPPQVYPIQLFHSRHTAQGEKLVGGTSQN
jgi:hypothetical protein